MSIVKGINYKELIEDYNITPLDISQERFDKIENILERIFDRLEQKADK